MKKQRKRRYDNVWTKEREDELVSLVASGQYLYREIADIMVLTRSQVISKAKRLGLSNMRAMENRLEHNEKLHLEMTRYYIATSVKETCERYKVTPVQLRARKAIIQQKFDSDDLRIFRRVDWSHDEIMFLLRHLGLKSRYWLGDVIENRTSNAVKRRSLLYVESTKYFHGLPLEESIQLLEAEDVPFVRVRNAKRAVLRKFVPWVKLYSFYKRKSQKDESVYVALRAMAKFQMMIYGKDTVNETFEEIRRIADGP